jgi:hypothetical protein
MTRKQENILNKMASLLIGHMEENCTPRQAQKILSNLRKIALQSARNQN